MLNRPQENSTPAPISVTAATSPAVAPAAAPPPPAGGGGGGATGTGGVAPPPVAPLVVSGRVGAPFGRRRNTAAQLESFLNTQFCDNTTSFAIVRARVTFAITTF